MVLRRFGKAQSLQQSMRMTRAFTCLLVLVVGCAGDDGTTGPLPGGGFTAADSISAVVTVEEDSTGRIVIASTSNLCSDARATPPIDRENQRFIVIELADVNGAATTAPTAAGTYTIYPNTGSRPAKSASFIAGSLDDACSSDQDASGQSGSVVLTAVASGKFTGSYDVVLNTGDHVTGTFAPSACPELQAAATNNDHTCSP
jgi:hypothetical protein